MRQIMFKTSLASIFVCAAFITLVIWGITGYSLMTNQSVSVFELFNVNISDDGLFIRISTRIWYVIAVTITSLTLFMCIAFLIRKRSAS